MSSVTLYCTRPTYCQIFAVLLITGKAAISRLLQRVEFSIEESASYSNSKLFSLGVFQIIYYLKNLHSPNSRTFPSAYFKFSLRAVSRFYSILDDIFFTSLNKLTSSFSLASTSSLTSSSLPKGLTSLVANSTSAVSSPKTASTSSCKSSMKSASNS